MYAFINKIWGRKFRFSALQIFIFITFLCWFIIWMILYYSDCELKSVGTLTDFFGKKSNPNYLVYNKKCQIPNLHPFNDDAVKFYRPESYETCTKLPLLTYLTHVNNNVILNVDKKAISSYLTKGVTCCYTNVTRKESLEKPDEGITTTECKMFKDNITVNHDTITVKCFSKKERNIIYENTHATYLKNDYVNEKINLPQPKKPISVLLIGIDSISRLNFIRSLPDTYNYVKDTGWIPLKGYNKMADNTLPNLMAILTGYNSSDIPDRCDPSEQETFDQCPMIWYDYKDYGYVTAYAEDECWMGTYNNKKRGFASPPTDFYFRPYMLASEKLTIKKIQGMSYCTGPETSGERIMNLAKDFAVTFKEFPHFGLFWMNTFSHNQLNTVSGMDGKIKDFLEVLGNEHVFEHSVVIFFSDHGIRFGGIRLTETGWYEERLPFIYVSFPSWFKQTFPTEFNNFKANSYRLSSPYDLHMTLQHLLVLSGHDYSISQSPGCPKCKSLLEEIDEERSCEEAGIEQHWCTCLGYTSIDLDEDVEKAITTRVLNKINKRIQSYENGSMCASYVLNNTLSTSVSKISGSGDTFLLLKFRTIPNAVFESTLKFKNDISEQDFSISGSISRLDRYFKHSNCVMNANLKKYCYCLY